MGGIVLAAWVGAQVAWLQQGFKLEFLGESTFVPGLWAAGLGFYVVNMGVLGVIVGDMGTLDAKSGVEVEKGKM